MPNVHLYTGFPSREWLVLAQCTVDAWTGELPRCLNHPLPLPPRAAACAANLRQVAAINDYSPGLIDFVTRANSPSSCIVKTQSVASPAPARPHVWRRLRAACSRVACRI